MPSNLAQPGYSPVMLARVAGILALIGIVTGAFDMGYVRNVVLVTGDAAQTLLNLQSHELLFRLGLVAHLVLLLCNVAGEIIFFLIFRRVDLILAAIIMACGLVGTAIESVDLLLAYVPLSLLADGTTLASFSPDQMKGDADKILDYFEGGSPCIHTKSACEPWSCISNSANAPER